jgi:hypothetical protein
MVVARDVVVGKGALGGVGRHIESTRADDELDWHSYAYPLTMAVVVSSS